MKSELHMFHVCRGSRSSPVCFLVDGPVSGSSEAPGELTVGLPVESPSRFLDPFQLCSIAPQYSNQDNHKSGEPLSFSAQDSAYFLNWYLQLCLVQST